MLFSNLHSLLKRDVTLNLILAAAGDDKIEVTVIPQSEKSAAGSQLVAKTFVATPQELDEQFSGVMAGYASANLSLQDQLQALQKQAEASAAAAAEAAKANAKKPTPKPGTTSGSNAAAAAKPALLADSDNLDKDGPGASTEVQGCDGNSDTATAGADQADLISL